MSAAIHFGVQLPWQGLRAGDQVMICMALVNTGRQAALVNARFELALHRGDVMVEVSRDGTVVPFEYRVTFGPVRPEQFIELQPGQRVVASRRLSDGWALDRPGRYEVRALYVNEQVPGALAAQPVFCGRLEAPPVLMTVGEQILPAV